MKSRGPTRQVAVAREGGAFGSVVRALSGKRGVATSRMFGSDVLKVDGKVFAMLVKGMLVVKLPASRVADVLRTGTCAPFDPGHGKVMTEWVSIPQGSGHQWLGMAQEALSFVQHGARTATGKRASRSRPGAAHSLEG